MFLYKNKKSSAMPLKSRLGLCLVLRADDA